MKTKPLSLAGLLAAGALACALVLAGCDNGTDPGGGGGGGGDGPGGGGGDTPKTVAAEYRFTVTVPDYTFTLGETTAVKTADGAFSLSGVYTEGGGTFIVNDDGTLGGGKWAYLYDNTGKKGFVLKFTSGTLNGRIEVILGKAYVVTVTGSSTYSFTPSPPSTGDMSSAPEDVLTYSP